ncbi:protein-disulfide reductase DsbD family protein [Actinomadura fulvescens]|uniref:Thiol:disulfide interchange protein DsbD N-terminal domain-containing protein n=1 Tax=Actinomadura fulvescens TaxID=46160 RepID=A0ABN3PTZ3_9ACTN
MRWLTLLSVALLLAGCGRGEDPVTARFTAGDVNVTIAVTADLVKVTFKPIRPGFHLYSLDLPPNDIGIPTRVTVRAGLKATGRPTANEKEQQLNLPLLGQRLPVYPDKPVTISLPVRRTARTAEIVVSYGACSRTVCLQPVIDRVTPLTLPL